MARHSRIKRWFGVEEKPLRPTVVEGIFDAGTQTAAGAPQSTAATETDAAAENPHHGDIPNPFYDEDRFLVWKPATARILDVVGSGTFIGPNQVCHVTLLVSIANDEPYRVSSTQLISTAQQSRWLVGSTRSALVDPYDHNRLIVD